MLVIISYIYTHVNIILYNIYYINNIYSFDIIYIYISVCVFGYLRTVWSSTSTHGNSSGGFSHLITASLQVLDEGFSTVGTPGLADLWTTT